VKARETLIKIAREEYGPENEMQFALIQQANKDVLHGGTRLAVGQELVIPPLPAATPPRPPGGAAPAPAYTVMGLEDLRRTFGPSPAPSGPTPAPGPAASRPPESAKQFHVVRRGETLAQIAREKMKDGGQGTVRRLYNANKDKIRDPDNLPIGVRLEIPA
jgi:nucleoid-associated protein YgaU